MNSKRYKLVTNEIWLQTGRLLQVWGIKPWSIHLNSATEARDLAGLRWCLARLWKGVYDRIDECVGRAICDSSQYLGLVKGRMCLLLKSAATSCFTPALLWRCAGCKHRFSSLSVGPGICCWVWAGCMFVVFFQGLKSSPLSSSGISGSRLRWGSLPVTGSHTAGAETSV